MLIRARRFALFQLTALAMSFIFLLVSCDNAAEPTELNSRRPASRPHFSEVPTGQEFYQALFQGRGVLVEEIPIVRDNYAASFFLADAEEDSVYNAVGDMMISAINDVDSYFFAEFQGKLTSGDPYSIDDALDRAVAVTIQAAATIPHFSEQMDVAAEDDSLIAGMLADIQILDPESNANADSISAAITGLGAGFFCDPLYCAWYMELALAMATVAALATFIAIFQGKWVAVYKSLAIYQNTAIYDGKFIWKTPDEPPPPDLYDNVGDYDPLLYEMLIAFIAENYDSE